MSSGESSSSSGTSHACPCCGRFAKSLSDLLRHVRLMHFGTPGFTTLKCNLEGGHRTFSKYAVFRNHIYEYHLNKLENRQPVATDTSSSDFPEICPTLDEDSDR